MAARRKRNLGKGKRKELKEWTEIPRAEDWREQVESGSNGMRSNGAELRSTDSSSLFDFGKKLDPLTVRKDEKEIYSCLNEYKNKLIRLIARIRPEE